MLGLGLTGLSMWIGNPIYRHRDEDTVYIKFAYWTEDNVILSRLEIKTFYDGNYYHLLDEAFKVPNKTPLVSEDFIKNQKVSMFNTLMCEYKEFLWPNMDVEIAQDIPDFSEYFELLYTRYSTQESDCVRHIRNILLFISGYNLNNIDENDGYEFERMPF